MISLKPAEVIKPACVLEDLICCWIVFEQRCGGGFFADDSSSHGYRLGKIRRREFVYQLLQSEFSEGLYAGIVVKCAKR
jgi:hypothetical protein